MFPVEWTFGTEELAAYSPVISEVEAEPFLFMHTGDASVAGVENGDRVLVHLDGGSLEIAVKASDRIASGTAMLPRHRRIMWQKIKGRPAFVPLDRIKRVES